MTHYENIKNATMEGMALVLTSLVVGAMGDVEPEEVPGIYADILEFLGQEATT